ncbi:MAG: hypothetical protein IPJ69_00020 [Deltaproteobacteria bacterium]|nr:MAG: hypothetical protein IPJ69_00020 [Deltaproteobacteria bacterium]
MPKSESSLLSNNFWEILEVVRQLRVNVRKLIQPITTAILHARGGIAPFISINADEESRDMPTLYTRFEKTPYLWGETILRQCEY